MFNGNCSQLRNSLLELGERSGVTGKNICLAAEARLDHLEEKNASLGSELKSLREQLAAAEWVLQQARPESGYWERFYPGGMSVVTEETVSRN